MPRVFRKYGGRKTFAAAVKAVTLRTSETKYVVKSVSGTGGPLNPAPFVVFHNSIVRVPIWDNITNDPIWPIKGDNDNQRDGDEIYVAGFMLRGILQIPADRRNTRVKVFFLPYNSKQGDPTNFAQLFTQTVDSNMLDPIQTDSWPGIKLIGTYAVRSSDKLAEGDATIMVKKWLPMKRKIKFAQASGVANPTNIKEMGTLLVCPYDSIQTSETDIIVTNMQWGITMYFKDP